MLDVREVSARDDDRILLDRVSFTVQPGEILGLTGIRQSGIETMEEILGALRKPTGGTMVLDGKEISGLSPRTLRRSGIGYVPTDRLLRGASLRSSVAENLIVLERRQLQRAGVFLPDRVRDYGARLAEEYGIDGVLHTPLNRLSGGNIQKVILSRELATRPRLLVVCEPSWGLDVRSRDLIYDRIRTAAREGTGVVLITTDVDEVLALSHRIGVIYDGRLGPIRPAHAMSRAEIGRQMAGSEPKAGGRA